MHNHTQVVRNKIHAEVEAIHVQIDDLNDEIETSRETLKEETVAHNLRVGAWERTIADKREQLAHWLRAIDQVPAQPQD